MPGFDLAEGPDCEKYTLSDNKACSIIYKRFFPSTTDDNGVMQVISIINGKMYLISYSTLPFIFDKNLPIAEHMINSFRVTSYYSCPVLLNKDNINYQKIWVDLDFTYDHRIIAYRLDDGVAGILKDGSLKKTQNLLDIYNYSGVGFIDVRSCTISILDTCSAKRTNLMDRLTLITFSYYLHS